MDTVLGLLDSGNGAAATVLIAFGLFMYFIPTLTAISNKKTNTTAIFALNLMLGWTLVGWVVSLVWALTKEPAKI